MNVSKGWLFLVIYVLTFIIISGCSNKAIDEKENHGDVKDKTFVYLSSHNEDHGQARAIMDLSREFEKEQKNTKIELETVAPYELIQRVPLLAASNDLPEMFAFESGQIYQMYEAGLIMDVEETFKSLGLYEKLNPTVVDLLKRQAEDGNGLYAVPVELNIEGFWYNKQLFEQVGVDVPKTWDDMMGTSELLKAEGIQPFAVAGQMGSAYTRLINAYVVRKYGFDVMERIQRGELELTDEGFIEAARVVQQMHKEGYFGESVNTVDYEAAVNMFLGGQAAMIYMGSWVLSEFNDDELNLIGVENIGFFNVPLVKEGVGTFNDYMMNAGLVLALSKEKYNEEVGKWLTFIFSNYAEYAISEYGILSGFLMGEIPENISPITKITVEEINKVKNGALWFEALFDETTSERAKFNAQLLVNDEMTPEGYMSSLKQ